MTSINAAPPAPSSAVPRTGHPRGIGRLGTTARVLVGVALLALGVIAGGHWIAWWQVALGILGVPAVIVAAHLARLGFSTHTLGQTSHFATCVNCAAIAGLLTVSPTRNATLVFLGSSMLLAAARGYGGCETLAISNWLLRRDDQVGCLVFAPLDRLEARPVSESHPMTRPGPYA
ncbi:MAG TPA: hypothetical protein VME22_14210 [Solirubrobacteraceae bacterium]|nr:hypothetical protein [Solirubrobacteraceae bacterium]